MDERLPWSAREAAGALLVVLAVLGGGLALLVAGYGLGWLFVGLGAWLVVGMVHTVAGPGRD
jgi:hypothetical protein